MATKILRAYGIGQPLIDVFPIPLKVNKAPTASDNKYPTGQIWIDQSLLPAPPDIWFWNGVTWILLGSGGGSLNTLTGDDLAPVAPLAGNIDIQGGASGAILFSNGGAGQMDAQVQVDGTSIVINASNQLQVFGSTSYSLQTIGATSDETPDIPITDNQGSSVFAIFSVANATRTLCASDLANTSVCCLGGVVDITLGDFIDVSICEDPALATIDFNCIPGVAPSTIRIQVTGVAGETLDWRVNVNLLPTI